MSKTISEVEHDTFQTIIFNSSMESWVKMELGKKILLAKQQLDSIEKNIENYDAGLTSKDLLLNNILKIMLMVKPRDEPTEQQTKRRIGSL